MAPPPRTIDVRSDTVTRPSQAMRDAMATADVGDDVYGEDPTVNALQDQAAKMTGMEAALFVASGTQGNLTAVLAHCPRGSEVILGDESHIYNYEGGGASAFGGVAFHVVRNSANGELPLEELKAAYRGEDQHYSPTALVCLESTHNRCGGTVLSLEYMDAVKSWADSKGLPVHMDGARIFNAAEALGVPVSELGARLTSLQICLSKGLGAPVGSLVCGPAAFIKQVHKLRKMLGGGMRQAGVLAGPGILALTQSSKRLHEDRANAMMMAEGLAKLPLVDLNLDLVQSNIVVFKLRKGAPSAEQLLQDLREQHRVLMIPFMGGIRAVTHVDVSREQCAAAVKAVEACMSKEAHCNGADCSKMSGDPGVAGATGGYSY